jgi:hypothetical protein
LKTLSNSGALTMICRSIACCLALLLAASAGAARAQDAPAAPSSALATDRPGFLFSSLTVGRGVVQAELGLPAITWSDVGISDGDLQTYGLPLTVRVGVSDALELRLGSPSLFTATRLDNSGATVSDDGLGDLEVGLKWHLLDADGARPSFALIPSVVVPVGDEGFSVEEPAYLLNAAAEWTLAGGWSATGLAGVRFADTGAATYRELTFGAALGRTLPDPAWSAYGEAVWVTNDLGDGVDAPFVGGGLKRLLSNDFQLDLFVDRGLSEEAPDWLFGFGVSRRF